jgi:acyl-coenzyme A synthetase/AMP-(fatty) acid ligase
MAFSNIQSPVLLAVYGTGGQSGYSEIVMAEQIGLFDDHVAAANRVVIQDSGREICVNELLTAATKLSQHLISLGSQPYVINLCKDRYQFIVGFCAALINGSTSLLPSNRQYQTIADLISEYPNSLVLADSPSEELSSFQCLNISSLPSVDVDAELITENPKISAEHIAAIVFTSGSSGKPTAIAKPWRTFVGTAKLLAKRFFGDGQSASIVATVPPQHMYGLETTVMMALHGDATVHGGQPFYADDIRSALEQVSSPRVLITTPVHLTALLAAKLDLAPLSALVSATAPLESSLADQAETQFDCIVSEIFGCSEAGSFATRRSCKQQSWLMLDGMSITQQSASLEVIEVSAEHLLAPVPLQDQLELISDSQFKFLGRASDMLNVAGKRASLAELSFKLQQIDGVDDAVCFLPDSDRAGLQRPAALVVSKLTKREILTALAPSVDPVFLPRPLKIVEAIPRNEVGKIPRHQLQQKLAE